RIGLSGRIKDSFDSLQCRLVVVLCADGDKLDGHCISSTVCALIGSYSLWIPTNLIWAILVSRYLVAPGSERGFNFIIRPAATGMHRGATSFAWGLPTTTSAST